MAYKNNSEENWQYLEFCLQAAWGIIPKEFFDAFIESIPRRIKACTKAKRWHTKYYGIGLVDFGFGLGRLKSMP
jgi:hypothetical protein